MDSEVDIGTARNLGVSLWGPPDFAPLSPSVSSRRLSSPSAPDVAEALDAYHPANSGLSHGRVRSAFNLRDQHPHVELPVLDNDQIAKIRRWISFDFNLDIGPVLHCLYPSIRLSAAWRENIAFSSFPDSAVFETGSQAHSFKLAVSKDLPESTDLSSESEFIYGYVYFVQRRDSTSRRGYLQRSVVILSHFAYPSLFEEMVTILAPLYLSHGSPMLESACYNISGWPDPHAGTSLELGFLGSVLQVHLPCNADELQFREGTSRVELAMQSEILASLPSTNPLPLVVFSACLPSLWSIWELLILCEPILIFGTSPRITSLAVWWLRDFIRPITVAGDFRPYMTIHDQDYTTLINQNLPKAGLVVGMTNPFVLSVTKHWPHTLGLRWEGNKPIPAIKPNNASRETFGTGLAPGFVSRTHTRFTSKDRTLLHTWEDALKKGKNLDDASQQLRRHFASQTASFLAPLNRYLNSLIPSPTEASARSAARRPRLKPFNPAHFLASLQSNGTPLRFRSSSKRREFYERWLRTSAFALWLAGQQEIVTSVLEETRLG